MELSEVFASLFWIVLVACIAPIVVGLLPGPRIPEVVLLLIGGVLIGQDVFDLAEVSAPIDLLSQLGLGFLFFLAGYELDLNALRGRPGRFALLGWVISLGLAFAVVGLLVDLGVVQAFLPVSIALTTTALGTLLPTMRDLGILDGPVGRLFVANGAVGEFGPILAISLFLGSRGAWASLVILAAFGVIAVLIAVVPKWLSVRGVTANIERVMEQGRHTTAQTSLRATVLLLLALLVVASEWGLDVILGAFAAGLALRRLMPADDLHLRIRVEGMAYGFFIPVFFIVSGVELDLDSIIANPTRLLLFFGLILVIRGLPALILARISCNPRQSLQVALYTATGLPLIVALTHVGLAAGIMLPENAAALVGAGALSVLFFPAIASALGGRPEEEADAASPASIEGAHKDR